VNWKTDLKLSDLHGAALVEIACRVCGQTRTETAAALMRRPEFEQSYLDEVESALQCEPHLPRPREGLRLFTMARRKGLLEGWRETLRACNVRKRSLCAALLLQPRPITRSFR
jgi:hypothetical protein